MKRLQSEEKLISIKCTRPCISQSRHGVYMSGDIILVQAYESYMLGVGDYSMRDLSLIDQNT